MPDYSRSPLKETVPKLLKELGSPIGEFNQGAFRTDIGKSSTGAVIDKSKYLNKPLGGGYCNGVCLDWIRRVLLSRPERADVYLTYQYETLKTKMGRTADKTGKKRSPVDSRLRAHQNVGVMADAYALTNDLSWYEDNPGRYEVRGSDWTKGTKKLDDFFDKGRKEAKREPSAKRFSALTLDHSKMSQYSSMAQWMNELFASGLQAGGATKIAFSLPGQSGHAVAVWQRKASATDADAFYLFDPNFGVIAYSSDGLRAAIQLLFGTDGDHIPFYDTCSSATTQKMSVMVFGPHRLVTATAVPKQPTVQKALPQPPQALPVQSTPPSSVTTISQPFVSTIKPAVQPQVVTPLPKPQTSAPVTPVNPQTIVPFTVPSPGNNIPANIAPKTVQPSLPSAGGSALKTLLIEYRDNPQRQIPGAFGRHGTVKGGWVSVPHTLIQKIKAANLTNSDFVVSAEGKFAVAKEHIDWLIARA
jgi:hypothetical protein